MNYDNLIYLNGNTIYQKNEIIEFPLDVVNKGIVLDEEKFKKIYRKNILKSKTLKKVTIVIHDNLSQLNQKHLLSIFMDFYFKVTIKQEISLIDINKEDCYLIYGDSINLYYIDAYNTKISVYLDRINLKTDEISYIINNRIKNKTLIIIGNSKKILEKLHLNLNKYYIVKNIEKFFLK